MEGIQNWPGLATILPALKFHLSGNVESSVKLCHPWQPPKNYNMENL